MATVEVISTDEFVDWYDSLDARDTEAVNYSVDLLSEVGVTLDHPHTSAIKKAGSRSASSGASPAGDPFASSTHSTRSARPSC